MRMGPDRKSAVTRSPDQLSALRKKVLAAHRLPVPTARPLQKLKFMARSKQKRLQQAEKGWRAVDVGDTLLLGSAEGGFEGLEELVPGDEVHIDKAEVDTAQRTEGAADEPARGAGARPAKKRRQAAERVHACGTSSSPSEDIRRLQAQLSDARAENARLRTLAQTEGADTGRDEIDGPDPHIGHLEAAQGPISKTIAGEGQAALNHKRRKRLKRQAELAQRRQERYAERKARRRQHKSTAADEPPRAAPEGPEGETSTPDSAAVEAVEADTTSWHPFELEDEIKEALGAMGFSEPTPIQQECLPAAIRDRRDVIGAAQTGSGKTLAFGLPILHALVGARKREQALGDTPGDATEDASGPGRLLRALILAPTRELAMQVSDHLRAVARPCGVWVVPIVGGIAAAKQRRMLAVRPEVVVATPGRLWELAREGEPHLANLSGLAFLVLDEADRMVQHGHFEELSSILDLIPRAHASSEDVAPRDSAAGSPEDGMTSTSARAGAGAEDDGTAGNAPPPQQTKLQTFVFSATLTMPDALRRRLRKGGGGAAGSATLESLMDKVPFRGKPKIVDLTSARRLADKVSESYLECTEADRDERLYYLLTQHPGRTLVFANAVSAVRRLAALLRLLQLPAAPLHASMQQRQRLRALDRFRTSDDSVLVATDVAARGLDIRDVACVVHYQIPASVDVYVHRCGRTARAEAEGVSVALVAPKEAARFSALLKALGREAPPLFPLDHDLLPGARARVRLATRLDEAVRLRSKRAAHATWEARAADAAGIDLSGSESDGEAVPIADGTGATAALQQELAELLREPLQPRFSRRYFAGTPSAELLGKAEGAPDEREPTAITQAVQQASRLSEAQRSGTAALARSEKRAKAKARKGADPRARALAAAIAKSGFKKTRSGKGRFVVIPGALGREAQGPNALEALKQKLGMQRP